MGVLPVPIVVVLVALVVATITDLRRYRIHNWLTLPLVVSGLIYHTATGGMSGLGLSAMGLLAGFGVFFFFYLIGGMGGGDVKLMAGIGAWVGAPLALMIAAFASIAAGLYALVVIVMNGKTRETWLRLQLVFHRAAAVSRHLAAEDRVEDVVVAEDRRARAIPFGAMITVGLVALIVIARSGFASGTGK